MITNEQLKKKMQAVKLLILDVDGVLTDGKLYMGPSGETFKTFNTQDGYGLKMLKRVGIEIAIISGLASKAVEVRMANFGVEHVFLGIEDKLVVFNQLVNDLHIKPDEVAYVGDDLADLCVMEKIGLKVTVQNGVPPIKAIADYITTRNGGDGAVRELCDLLCESKI